MNKFHLFLLGTLLFAFSTHAAPPIISYSGQVAVNGSPSRVPGNSNSPLWVETDNSHIGARMAPVLVVPNQPDTYPPWSAMGYIPSCSGMMRSPVWERSMNPSFKIITMCIYASGLATESMDSSNSHPIADSPPSPTPSPVTEPTKPTSYRIPPHPVIHPARIIPV